MQKKGQITLFIILGVIVILGITTFLVIRNQSQKSEVLKETQETASFNAQVNSINSYLQTCVDNAASVSVKLFGFIGSNTLQPSGAFNENPNLFPIAYLRYNNKNNLESLDEWSKTLSALTYLNLKSCDLSIFASQGYTVENSITNVKTIINQNNVEFTIVMPTNITRGSLNKEISNFRSSVSVRLPVIHETVNSIINNNLARPGFFGISELIDYDVQVDTSSFDSGKSMLYFITDKDYLFVFADKDEQLIQLDPSLGDSFE